MNPSGAPIKQKTTLTQVPLVASLKLYPMGRGRQVGEHVWVRSRFVPYLGGTTPIVKQATRYLLDSKYGAIQSEELHRVCLRFANHDPAEDAVRLIVKTVQQGAREKASAGRS